MLVLSLTIGLVLFLGGVPVFAAFLATGSLLALFVMDVPISTIAHVLFSSVNSFTMVAVPFYVLMGELALRTGGADAAVQLLDDLIGHIKGALAIVVVLGCTFFAAVTGTSTAVIAAVGTILAPIMLRLGYGRGFTGGLLACAGSLGELIPPSLYMILYGPIVGVSVLNLFMAGIFPGLLSAFAMLVPAIVIARKQGYGGHAPVSWPKRGRSFAKAFPIIILPIFILGGLYAGIFTPTEAAVTGCVYCLGINVFYRGLGWKSFWEGVSSTLKTTSFIILLVGSAILLGNGLTYLTIPQQLTQLVIDLGVSELGFLFVSVVIWVILGIFLDALPILYITVPLLWPVANALGVDPIHFGIILVQSLLVGQITPPMAIGVYVSSSITGVPSSQIFKGAMPYFIAMVLVLIIITLVPQISLFLPGLLRS